LKMIFLIALPIAIVIFMIPDIIVDIVYGRGAYDTEAILKTARGLKYYAFCLLPYCIKQVYTKAFYSMDNTKTPMKIGIMEVCVNIISSIILARIFGIQGVVMGTAIASTVFCVVLIVLFHKKYISLKINNEKRDIVKIVFAFCVAAIISKILLNSSIELNNILYFIVYAIFVIGVYSLLLFFEQESELHNFVKSVGKKIYYVLVLLVMICIAICMYVCMY